MGLRREAFPSASRSLLPVRVLHVDDDPGFTELTAASLEREHGDVEVVTTTSAEVGLELLEEGSIDCVVSDYDVAGTSSLDFLRVVRDRYPELPFVLFTDRGPEEVAGEAISAGATDYLQKGTGPEQFTLLSNRIVNAVSKYRAEREVERGFQALDAAREGLGLLDETGRFTFVNRAFADTFGYDRAELVGEHQSLLYPGDDQHVCAKTRATVPDEGRWTGEAEFVRKDGTRILTDHALAYTDDGTEVCLVSDITWERVQDRALQEERQRFDLFVDSVSEYAIFMLDTQGYVTSWNEGAERIKGYDASEILGKHFSTFYTEEAVDADRPEQMLARALADGSVTDEGWRVRRDGSRFWARVTVTPVYDEDGRHAGFGKVTRDVTARHEREEELVMEERFLEAALDTLEDVFYVLDTDFEFLRFNDELMELTGHSEDELLSMSILELLPDDDRKLLRDELEVVLDRGEMLSELVLPNAGGMETPLEIRHSQLHDDAGDVIGIVGIGRDLTIRKEYERELEMRLRQQEVIARLGERALRDQGSLDELFRETVAVVAETLDTSHCKVLELLPDGDELLLRAGVGWDDGSVGHATVGTGLDSQAGYTLRSSEPVVVDDLAEETRFSGPDLLTDHGIRSGISVVVGTSDDAWGVLGVHDTGPGGFAQTDVDFVQSVANILATAIENRRNERTLREKNERLEEFASVLSHDLRNPLAVASGRTELARTECDSEHLDAVVRAHDRIEELIEELLAVTREAERGNGTTETVWLSDLATQAWSQVAVAGATLDVETDCELEGNPVRLQQAFENLFRNAVEHGAGPERIPGAGADDGDVVTVRVGALDGGFYVEDDGPGIPEAARERVFVRGVSNDGGNGLGLSIVEDVVTAHCWTVDVTGGTEGGARFEIRFPDDAS